MRFLTCGVLALLQATIALEPRAHAGNAHADADNAHADDAHADTDNAHADTDNAHADTDNAHADTDNAYADDAHADADNADADNARADNAPADTDNAHARAACTRTRRMHTHAPHADTDNAHADNAHADDAHAQARAVAHAGTRVARLDSNAAHVDGDATTSHQAPRAARGNAWHAGLNLRSELGTHPIRIDGGVRVGRLDLVAVLDPMVWTDGELDIDLLASFEVSARGYAVFGGWRPASIAMAHARQFQHAALVGAMGPLPSIGPIDMTWGLEIATVIVKHGGDLPTDVVSFDSTADIGDNVNISMFLRVGFHRAL